MNEDNYNIKFLRKEFLKSVFKDTWIRSNSTRFAEYNTKNPKFRVCIANSYEISDNKYKYPTFCSAYQFSLDRSRNASLKYLGFNNLSILLINFVLFMRSVSSKKLEQIEFHEKGKKDVVEISKIFAQKNKHLMRDDKIDDLLDK